jgi:hypothetical protein
MLPPLDGNLKMVLRSIQQQNRAPRKYVCRASHFLSGAEAEKIVLLRFQDDKSPFRW